MLARRAAAHASVLCAGLESRAVARVNASSCPTFRECLLQVHLQEISLVLHCLHVNEARLEILKKSLNAELRN